MKISWFKRAVVPEIGCLIAGYGPNDVSVAKRDDLMVTGLCVDDGSSKVLLMSCDLIGLDRWIIEEIRKRCAEILNIPESAVMISPTHTHSGPQTRSSTVPLNMDYINKFTAAIYEAVSELPEFVECTAVFCSRECDYNQNRRYTTPDNHTSFLPHCVDMRPLAKGFADKELGILCFYNADGLLYVIGNYAAHPLAGHAPGLGGLTISADFPGYFRDYISKETGAEAMFISGAAGDMVPKGDELGSDAAREVGVGLAKEAIAGIICAQRAAKRFKLADKVGSCTRKFAMPMRPGKSRRDPGTLTPDGKLEMEIQCVALGDICFVGVPGELCAELGQEIKWHSPFCRTFIAYNATSYFDYICPGNFLVSGGYEGGVQLTSSRTGLTLVNTAVDAMYELREAIFPSPEAAEYPDYLKHNLVWRQDS